MPELPEVETVRRGLVPVMEGHVIARAEVRRPDLRRPFPPHLAERLTGARVLRLGRRSKYLLAELSSGETMIVHLGMSGRILVAPPGGGGGAVIGDHVHDHGRIARHDHLILTMETGARVTLNDARRFGSVDLVPTAEAAAHPLLADLGPEPMGNGFSEETLIAALKERRTPVKAALLDQRLIAGLGNIYVCEALHRAGIDPRRQAGRIAAPRVGALARAIREVLAEAIAAGGSSLRDYRQTDGELGYFQHAFRVYGREGEPCLREGCGGTVRRIVQAGRSSFFCPRCQR
jgi:formamidopyrimidine-DNA glycosylase